jgi:tRNA(Ile)-lysidine synthase
VRFRAPGEAVLLSVRGRLSLKNLFQEWRVPVWERGMIPLIFCGEKLIQALGYFVDPDYAAKQDEAGVELKLERA